MAFDMKRVVKLRRAAEGEWVTCPLVTSNPFELCINFMDSDQWTRLLARSKKPTSNEIDTDKLARLIADESVSNWRGLTKPAMIELFPGLEPDQIDEIPDDGVPCNAETKYVLLREHSDLFKWVSKLSNDRAEFVAQTKERARGN